MQKGCRPTEQEILFSENQRTKSAFEIKKKRNCCSRGSCGIGLLISAGSERARVPRKMKLVFQILLRISSALDKAFFSLVFACLKIRLPRQNLCTSALTKGVATVTSLGLPRSCCYIYTWLVSFCCLHVAQQFYLFLYPN